MPVSREFCLCGPGQGRPIVAYGVRMGKSRYTHLQRSDATNARIPALCFFVLLLSFHRYPRPSNGLASSGERFSGGGRILMRDRPWFR